MKNWKLFIQEFEKIDSLYRQGKFEGDLHEGKSLKKAADELYKKAKAAWDNASIPSEIATKVLRAMTVSFEIDEYFLCLSQEKKDFFQKFNDEFLIDKYEITEKKVLSKIQETAERKKILEPTDDFELIQNSNEKESLLRIADELILFALCCVNVYYTKHNVEDYKKGLSQAEIILKYLDITSKKKWELSGESIYQFDASGSSLKGLTYYFIGRFNFGLGSFEESEAAFKKSSSMYIAKMNSLVSSTDKKDSESRTLSMRRSNLSEIIGLVNLYLIQSRIDEALDVLHRVRPLLDYNAGEVTKSYCNLLNVSVNRAKFSSKSEKLLELYEEAKNCLGVFERLVPDSHFPHRTNIEVSLLLFYIAKSLPQNEILSRKKYYNECLSKLDEGIKYAVAKPSDDKPFKNRRILIEASSLRSHIYRNYADAKGENFRRMITNAYKDAKLACEIADGLKQLESDALIALGTVYRDLFVYGKNNVPILKIEDQKIKDNVEWLEKSQKCFHNAIELNGADNNPRIYAICFLRLTDLETKSTTNTLGAKFYFDKYKSIEDKVGHYFVLEFADSLRNYLERRPYFDLLIDPGEKGEKLNLEKWKVELEEFLIRQTIYYAAIDAQGRLPARRRRGEEPVNDAKINSISNTRETRQSVLAKAFIDKMGIAPNPAYKLADKHLTEFEYWCKEMSDSAQT